MLVDAVKAIKGLLFDTKVDLDGADGGGAIVGPGVSVQTHAVNAFLSPEGVSCNDADIFDAIMAYDDACIDAMVCKHGEMFPKSAHMNVERVEAMFKPVVKRPLRRSVHIPFAPDLLVQKNGEDVDVNTLVKSEVYAELLLEFGGFRVSAEAFEPVVIVSEISLCDRPVPPPVKRASRIKRVVEKTTP